MFGAIAAIIIFYMIGKFIKDNKESKNRKEDINATAEAIVELERQRDINNLKERVNTLERELELTQRNMRK